MDRARLVANIADAGVVSGITGLLSSELVQYRRPASPLVSNTYLVNSVLTLSGRKKVISGPPPFSVNIAQATLMARTAKTP
jgi:hypothetical protein